jgi:hypothetical protein
MKALAAHEARCRGFDTSASPRGSAVSVTG